MALPLDPRPPVFFYVPSNNPVRSTSLTVGAGVASYNKVVTILILNYFTIHATANNPRRPSSNFKTCIHITAADAGSIGYRRCEVPAGVDSGRAGAVARGSWQCRVPGHLSVCLRTAVQQMHSPAGLRRSVTDPWHALTSDPAQKRSTQLRRSRRRRGD